VECLESKASLATQNPRKEEEIKLAEELDDPKEKEQVEVFSTVVEPSPSMAIEKHFKIHYGDIGYGYEKVFEPYLIGAKEIRLEDPFIRQKYQIINFLKFCELAVKIGDVKKIILTTWADDIEQQTENQTMFDQIANSLFDNDVELEIIFSNTLHDRNIYLSNGWRITMGRGLDYFQSLAGEYFQIGANDQDLRPCLETNFDFIWEGK
jgi:ATP-dependent Lon protease